MTQPMLYKHAAVLAPRTPATRHEARAISRLATKAQALAGEYGEVLTRREALRRARTNLDYVKAMAGQPDIEREATS